MSTPMPPAPPPPTYSMPPPPPRRGWWSRHWKWAVPVGCFSLLLIGAAIVLTFIIAILGFLKSSGPYAEALAEAVSHPEVIEALGEPIEARFWVMGSVNVSGPSGHADISIPISGPRGRGTVYAAATRSMGQWRLNSLAVKIAETGQRIELIEGGAGPSMPHDLFPTD